jgi:hypothetical protein
MRTGQVKALIPRAQISALPQAFNSFTNPEFARAYFEFMRKNTIIRLISYLNH